MSDPTLFSLKRAYQAARSALDAELHGQGLTSAQFDVLKFLLHPEVKPPLPSEGLDQRALQRALGITSATLTRLLAGMERRGLISRQPNPRDSRGKQVSVTARARKLFERLLGEREEAFHARVFAGFSPQELRGLNRLLKRIAVNLCQPPV